MPSQWINEALGFAGFVMTEKNAQVCCWMLDSTFPNGQGEVDLAMLVVARPGWDCQNARLKFGFFLVLTGFAW
jgi:hypothetical protein